MQLPALQNTTEDKAWPYQEGRVTQERMLREMAEAIEVLTTVRPVVLVLEDLHWSDAATLAWLAYVARRVDQARLLILGTYRPMDVLVQGHPLYAVKHELHIHRQCDELILEGLTETEVLAYFAARYGKCVSLEVLPRVIHQRTNGNPLFMALLTEALGLPEDRRAHRQGEHWRATYHEVALCIPESLRQLIELQLALVCPEDQVLLETASVVGVRFSAAAVAAGMDCTVEDIETRLAALARHQQFVQHQGTTTWLDGTVAASYRFIHALYQETLYARVSASRRVRLQQAITAQPVPWSGFSPIP